MRLTSLKKYWWILLEVLALLLLSPARLAGWRFTQQVWQPLTAVQGVLGALPIEPILSADLQGNGRLECLDRQGVKLTITDCHGQALWSSPDGWQVRDAQIGDLNHDGEPEVVLLVWRPFQPWPIDKFLPSGGRIQNFHNQAGLSCHIILIGWVRGGYNELWAGSALIRPVSQIGVADLDGDGGQELVALEGHYDEQEDGGALTVWQWNGFGFTLADQVEQNYQGLQIIGKDQQKWVIVQK